MTSLRSRPEVVVVGAGAAGIAAARELRNRGVDCLVVEARDRIGGRAWTASIHGQTLDLGCEWLHSADRNILARFAEDHGIDIDKRPPPWRNRASQKGFDRIEHEAFQSAHTAFDRRLETAAANALRTGRDVAASDLLDRADPWSGFMEAVSTFYSGAPLERVSVIDLDRYTDTEVNWRVSGGYGTLVATLGADLPIKRNCVVEAIDATGRSVLVSTSIGQIETDQVIITLPTDVIASGAIRFSLELAGHVEAASGLPLGLANKAFLRMDGIEAFDVDTHVIGHPGQRDTGVYTFRPGGKPLVEGYFGGDYAERLERDGPRAFEDAARRELSAALGHDIGNRLVSIVTTSWRTDRFAMGSYSYALPGRSDCRATLSTPVDDRIFFAGEGTSRHFFSTAHGAFEEGLRAAKALALMREKTLRS